MSASRQIIPIEMFETLEKFGSESIVNILKVNVAARHLLRQVQSWGKIKY